MDKYEENKLLEDFLRELNVPVLDYDKYRAIARKYLREIANEQREKDAKIAEEELKPMSGNNFLNPRELQVFIAKAIREQE